jgi:CheY-like chemotaxis protein
MSEEGKRKILLIDDDTSLLLTLSDFLSFEGYDVTTADCGEKGLEVLDATDPHLIILDMSMPGMGGIGFLKEITSADGKPRYPVLVLTARANMAEFFADIDVDGFIAKPCDPADLLMEVGRIIFLTSGEATAAIASAIKKVLVAEDDRQHNNEICAALKAGGYDVCSVIKGPDVLEKAIIEKPDVIVMKLVLSGMNGDAVAAVLKEMPNTKGIPIVLYDDSGIDHDEEKFLQSGASILRFVRGHQPEVLVGAVAKLMGV